MKSHTNILYNGLATFVATILATILATHIIPLFTPIVINWRFSEYIAFFSAAGSVSALISISIQIISNRKPVYKTDVVCSVLSNNTVVISSSIENVGQRKVYTKAACLVVDHGLSKQNNGITSYQFPFILRHDVRGKYCELKRIYDKEECFRYPSKCLDDCASDIHQCIPLQLLTKESIQYINPKEKVSEDIVLTFQESGVYRVTFIVIADGSTDCSCASKQFYVS